MELEEKVAKSKAKVKVFEELEQRTTALNASFLSRKNAPREKIMQADSYGNVPLLDAPHQRCTEKREHGRYLTRNFNPNKSGLFKGSFSLGGGQFDSTFIFQEELI